MSEQTYGELNAHALGTLIKEAARRGALKAHEMRRKFKARVKSVKASGKTDWVTDADIAAQAVIVKKLREWFPTFGIIGEESDVPGVPLRIPCTHPTLDIWFTIDPIDGTSAFKRRQSHGIGCMISLVCDDEIICVCIVDIMTSEFYYFRPGSQNVWRIESDEPEPLKIDEERPLGEQYLLLRDLPEKRSPLVQLMVGTGLFQDTEVGGGSIGISMARLWKGEVGGEILSLSKDTPWDSNPVIGMGLKTGFDFWIIDLDSRSITRFDPTPVREECYRAFEILVVHSSRRDELRRWCECHGISCSI